MTAGLSRRLPKWFAILGVVLALIGELSWLFLMTPKALLLIPLVRFPGFPWLIAAAALLHGGAGGRHSSFGFVIMRGE